MIIGCMSACTSSSELSGTRFVEFETKFINQLPQEVADTNICRDEYVEQLESVLGDPNYVISFTLKFHSLSELQNHLNRIDTASGESLQRNDQIYYIFQGSKEDLLEYTDSRIYDGYFFVYEIIAINTETLEADYLYAYVWDYWKNDFLISKLTEVFIGPETQN